MRERSSITALLGPTNTGKTHRAVERMLDHPTGMIGLPLRLLAREVFDRITARVGEERVALITGEEKRVPKRPAYWVCTVEAMPLDHTVDFVAVDEIQLAAHPQRGHVFTQRLLSARGTSETWFLGSDSMREIVGELVPHATIVSHPRLSSLTFAGSLRLPKLPPRSAAVAFSTEHVHELAERVKRAFGGVAVVLGALSPRTRNAQVAMFQAGEVDHLVATDAIGMGLNLAVDHVAFASLRKFDGREQRELDPSEVAQIAGRAGRYHNDGTFGAVSPLQFPESLAALIEMHRFPSVRRLIWRNDDLDFTSLDGLIHSLKRPPPSRLLRLIDNPEDTEALLALATRSEVRAHANGAESIRLLWDVCTVPDFRKLLFEAHVALLAELFVQLAGPAGRIDETWLEERIAYCDDPRGDVETLLGRIAAVRTWTYVTNRSGWIEHGAQWQARARDVEDRLSDALHAALVQRFVDPSRPRRTTHAARPRTPPRTPTDEHVAAPHAPKGHPFAALASLRDAMSPEPTSAPPSDEATRRDWIESLVDAPFDRFDIDARGRISFDDALVAQLVRGTRLILPDVKLVEIEGLGGGAQARVLRRLVAFARDWVGHLLATLRDFPIESLSPSGQRVAYLLEQSLGAVRTVALEQHPASFTIADRAWLARAGIVIERDVTYVRTLLEPHALEARATLAEAWFGRMRINPSPTAASFRPGPRDLDGERLLAMGYLPRAGYAVRIDVCAAAHSLCTELGVEGVPLDRLARLLEVPADEARKVARAIAPDAPRDTSGDDVAASKRLSHVLRHAPNSIGITLDAHGWIDVDTLLEALAAHGPSLARDRLERIVARSDKQRFAFSEDGSRIRANQGHSVAIDLALPAAEPPATLYHGTAIDRVERIVKEGLHRGRRHDVHLSEREDTARAVGARHGKPVVIAIDAAAMRRDGSVFRRSANGVWLIPHVPARYLHVVSDLEKT